MFGDRLIAHRGASGYAPENTLAAFKKAVSMGMRWIEFDVMLSKDGVPFVFHDETLERTTNGHGKFGRVNAEYIDTLDAGSSFSKVFAHEPVPTLSTVLSWLAQNDVCANIEIKPFPGFSQETALATLQAIHRYWPNHENRLLVSSFDIDVLRLCRQFEPEMQMGFLLNKWQEDSLVCAKELNCMSIHLNKKMISAARVQQLKKLDFLVLVYTVNRRREAHRFLGWGVDALFTNYPDLFELTLKRKLFKKILDKKIIVA
jgi:glycerophosphoryl diester phosphodiesterase